MAFTAVMRFSDWNWSSLLIRSSPSESSLIRKRSKQISTINLFTVGYMYVCVCVCVCVCVFATNLGTWRLSGSHENCGKPALTNSLFLVIPGQDDSVGVPRT